MNVNNSDDTAGKSDEKCAELHDDNEHTADDGLPHIGNDSPFKLNHENDPFFFHDDTAETITISNSESSELVPDETPFYANQEENPEVWASMFDDIL